jgi:hypothetical protein
MWVEKDGPDIMSTLMTPEEVADQLRMSVEALKQMRRRGEGPPFIQVTPRKVLYDEVAVQRWLLEHTRLPSTG